MLCPCNSCCLLHWQPLHIDASSNVGIQAYKFPRNFLGPSLPALPHPNKNVEKFWGCSLKISSHKMLGPSCLEGGHDILHTYFMHLCIVRPTSVAARGGRSVTACTPVHVVNDGPPRTPLARSSGSTAKRGVFEYDVNEENKVSLLL